MRVRTTRASCHGTPVATGGSDPAVASAAWPTTSSSTSTGAP
jgi:hypothetical protein